MGKIIKNNLLKVLIGVGTAGFLFTIPIKAHAKSMMSQISKNLVYGLFTHPIQAEKQCQEKMAKMNKYSTYLITRIHSHHITLGYMTHHTGRIKQMSSYPSKHTK